MDEEIIQTVKYEYMQKNSESGHPIYMKRLRVPCYSPNADGKWEMLRGDDIEENAQLTVPATRKEYIRWKIDEWRSLNDLSMYFKQARTDRIKTGWPRELNLTYLQCPIGNPTRYHDQLNLTWSPC